MEKCRICGWTGEALSINVREMMLHTKEEFAYFECGNCHCLQIRDIPKNLQDYYGDTYYSYSKIENKETNSISSNTNETRVLDVGCGSGAFLFGLAKQGYVNLTGCDPFITSDIEYENGVKIYKKTIHEMSGEFDWIYLNDSFEHVTDPNEVMNSIRRLLSKRGIAKIKIPIYPNIAYDMFGANWFQIDAPRHIYLHSQNSMKYLADENELAIVKCEYDSGISQIVRSFLYSKDIPFKEHTGDVIRRFFSNQEIEQMSAICKVANQNGYGDHAEFYLTHKSNVCK